MRRFKKEAGGGDKEESEGREIGGKEGEGKVKKREGKVTREEGRREGEKGKGGREMKRGKDSTSYIYNDDMAKLVLIHVTFVIMTNLSVHSALCQYM